MSTLGDRIKEARKARGWTQQRLAEEMGVSRPAVGQWESNEAEPRGPKLRALAHVLQVEYDWLARESPDGPKLMAVLGEVAGGVWRETNWFEHDPIPVAADPTFPVSAQYALIVRGPSANRVVADGEYVHVVDVTAAGLAINVGDLVVVERQRGGERETTLKRLARTMAGQLMLLPESDHPDFQQPIPYQEGDEATEVRVKAVALGKYVPFHRRRT